VTLSQSPSVQRFWRSRFYTFLLRFFTFVFRLQEVSQRIVKLLLVAYIRRPMYAGVSIHIGQGGDMSPNILGFNSYNCCLFILMQIVCVVSQNSFSFWGTSSPRSPTAAPPLDPAGGLPSPRSPAFFYVPLQYSCEIDALV